MLIVGGMGSPGQVGASVQVSQAPQSAEQSAQPSPGSQTPSPQVALPELSEVEVPSEAEVVAVPEEEVVEVLKEDVADAEDADAAVRSEVSVSALSSPVHARVTASGRQIQTGRRGRAKDSIGGCCRREHARRSIEEAGLADPPFRIWWIHHG